MLHYTFLWQVLGMIISFGSMVVILMQYRIQHQRGLLLLFLSVVFTFARTVLFTVSNYSIASRTPFLSARFGESLPAGFFYILLISLSVWFMICGLSSLYNRRVPFQAGIIYWLYYSLTLALFLIMIAGIHPSWTPFSCLFRQRIMVDLPFILCRIVLIGLCIGIIAGRNYENRMKSSAFILSVIAVQIVDFIGRFFPQAGLITTPLYFLLPGLIFIILLPRMLGKGLKDSDRTVKAGALASRFGLEADELEIVTALLSGKSNKEIAFDQKLTLSTVKHRIYQIYRKCGISSRWELFAEAEKPV